MKQLLITVLLSILLFSCADDKGSEAYLGKWTELKKTGNDYVIVNCGYEGQSITVYKDSVFSKGTMEDFTMPVDHANYADSVQLYSDEAEKTYYSFSWADEQKGIAKWLFKQDGLPDIVRYYVNSSNLKNIKTIKGTDKDCVTADEETEEPEDIFKPDFTTKDGKTAIKLIRENCLELIDVEQQTTLMDKCFDNVMLQIRPLNSNALPLTFISGKHYIDVNFILINNEWTANEVTIFDPATGSETGITKPFTIALKDFNYINVIEQTE